jgi:hypothetical protein
LFNEYSLKGRKVAFDLKMAFGQHFLMQSFQLNKMLMKTKEKVKNSAPKTRTGSQNPMKKNFFYHHH